MTEHNKKKTVPENKQGHLPINQETLDILVANIIPTSKYFEARFDHMQDRIDKVQTDLRDFRKDVDSKFSEIKTDINQRFQQVDQRFEQVDKRFEQVDQRFEQVDKRFEQVDKRFEQVIASINKLTDRLEQRDENQRNFTLRMFTISITISILGVTGAFMKILGLF